MTPTDDERSVSIDGVDYIPKTRLDKAVAMLAIYADAFEKVRHTMIAEHEVLRSLSDWKGPSEAGDAGGSTG